MLKELSAEQSTADILKFNEHFGYFLQFLACCLLVLLMFLLQPLPDILYKYLLVLTVQVHLVTSYHYGNILAGK